MPKVSIDSRPQMRKREEDRNVARGAGGKEDDQLALPLISALVPATLEATTSRFYRHVPLAERCRKPWQTLVISSSSRATHGQILAAEFSSCC